MDNLRERILRVVRLEEVVERYLSLGRVGAGSHTLVGICPFHDDRHPSLRVRTDKQYYKCFACGQGGDVFSFVQEIEGIGFREALLKLAAWYGLSAEADSPRDAARDTKPGTGLLHPVRRPTEPFRPQSVVSPAAIGSLLREHSLMLNRLAAYVPTDAALADTYRAFEVGIAPEALPASYGSFSRRLVFPIRSEAGELVAFAGRHLGEPNPKTPKYVNSPTTAIYRKDRLLYGLYQAKEAIRRHRFAYITEGYKDVLAMHAAGFPHTVALCGTALTPHHAALLRRHTARVVLMLDGDSAGVEGSRRAATCLQAAGLAVSFVSLAPGEDPDSMFAHLAPEKFAATIRRLTKVSRLETYERQLLHLLQTAYANLDIAFSAEDRQQMLRHLLPLRRRLAKVTARLGRNVVTKPSFGRTQ